MEKLSKQSGDWVTRFSNKLEKDAFLKARIRLTIIYTATATFILSIFSYVLYGSLVAQISDSVQDKIFDPYLRRIFLDRARDIIQSRIIFDDLIVLSCVLVLGFLLTKWTLKPIKESMDKQKRFIADASHELRTPIAILKTQVEVEMRRKNISSRDAHEALEEILEEVNVLANLANNLLDISKQGNNKGDGFEKISLNAVLNDSISKMGVIAQGKNISITDDIHLSDAVKISGNVVTLTQLFFNILNNAILYTPNGGSIKIESIVKDQMVIVNIKDTGKGISKDKLPHIFEPFYRSLDSNTSADGAGLGLTIAKNIVESHGGGIYIDSEINVGTSVIISLPIAS